MNTYYNNLSKILRYTFTTEEDFQRLLDANPEDHGTRLVFADWLQDRDDPRALGYRALGMLKRQPYTWKTKINEKDYDTGTGYHNGEGSDITNRPVFDLVSLVHSLPQDWIDIMKGGKAKGNYWSHYWDSKRGGMNTQTRQEAEDAAALAFTKLPPERQEQLLRGEE